ncbi:predicted protein [Naegleria gruberi]|uniref:Predicted protein n=1 Tax=Naegleria gruberi TaxID=5762 RepID=D2VMJ2_NAEGR|nr:uncharacterized protein NAEGRDRAFT_70155 [Naegleria gruberi]EFC41996.1 predicted protein [Naegleria gruberi]|eukprot:XP_002674740.1 predicted protein [Naegleria gruberi strain NEG-M]
MRNSVILCIVACLTDKLLCQKPNLIVKPSRTTGTAPLAVHFDATATTLPGKDAFRDITYSFDFGDVNSGNWSTDGKSKNTQIGGPISAHVYDNAGTYTVWIRASAPGYYYSDVTLTNPNVDFAGNKTVCVSTSGNYNSCPSGALKQKTIPTGTEWSGKRWLLRRGETFDEIAIQDGNSNVQVGAFGSASQLPIVAKVGVGSWRPDTPDFPVDISIMDLSIPGGVLDSLGKRHLFYRNNITGCDNALCVGFGEPYYWIFDDPYRRIPISSFYNPQEFFYVDNIAVGNTATTQGNFFGSIAKSAFMGNYAKCKATLSTNGWITQFNVISNNILGSLQDNNVWGSMISPQNGAYPERITDIIIENNQYIIHRNDQYDLILSARNVTYRANTRSDGKSAAVMFGPHGEALPAYWLGPYYTTNTPVVNVTASTSNVTPIKSSQPTAANSGVKGSGSTSSERVGESNGNFACSVMLLLLISLIFIIQF